MLRRGDVSVSLHRDPASGRVTEQLLGDTRVRSGVNEQAHRPMPHVSIVNGRLFVKDQPRQAMVEQVYREAFAVQQIVGELLAPVHMMVRPVLCIHGARLPWLHHSVGGVRVVSGARSEI